MITSILNRFKQLLKLLIQTLPQEPFLQEVKANLDDYVAEASCYFEEAEIEVSDEEVKDYLLRLLIETGELENEESYDKITEIIKTKTK